MVKGPEEWTLIDPPTTKELLRMKHQPDPFNQADAEADINQMMADEPEDPESPYDDEPELDELVAEGAELFSPVREPTVEEEKREQRAKERLKEKMEKALQADTRQMVAEEPSIRMTTSAKCRADLTFVMLNERGGFAGSDESTTLMVTGSLVFVGEVVRAAGRAFAEEMYMHDIATPDSANREV